MKSWQMGINRYTLLYIKQINNRDLLYSTRDPIQYCIMTSVGKESEKNICIQLNHFAIYLKVTQPCKSTRIFFKVMLNVCCIYYYAMHEIVIRCLFFYLNFLFYFFSFIFISWRLITLQYYSGFCHTLT